jgi:hypothetical protein
VYFDGTTHLELPNTTIPSGNSNFTVFIIANTTYLGYPAQVPYFLSAGQSDGSSNVDIKASAGYDFYRYYPTLGFSGSNLVAQGDMIGYSETFIFSATYQPGNQDIYVNNEIRGQSYEPSRDGSYTSTFIGWNVAQDAVKLTGSINEIIVYDSRLVERDMNTVYDYLRKKYF